MKAHRQQMGMTLIQSLMVIAISAVLGVLGTVTYRAIVDQAYVLKVAEHLESQMDYLINQSYVDYEDMQDTLYKGQIDPAYPLGDGNYLDDLIATGKLPILPLEGFNDQDSLTWAIRAPNVGGQKLYYIHISSDDTRDGQLINEALSMANISSDYVDLVNP